MRRDDSLLIYVTFFVGTAFVLGVMALLLIGPPSPLNSMEAEVPLTWIVAFMLLLIGPPVGTLVALIWGDSNGR